MKLIPAVLVASCLTFSFGYLQQPAYACMGPAPFKIEVIRRADVVFSGRLIRYERVLPSQSNTLGEHGLLTFRVDQKIKGDISGDIQLYWWNSTFALPDTMERPEQLLIAAVRLRSEGLALRGKMQVLQAPCASPFILPYSQQSVDNITTILSGGTVEPYDYFKVRK